MSELYTSYIETFLTGLADYARAEAVIDETRSQ